MEYVHLVCAGCRAWLQALRLEPAGSRFRSKPAPNPDTVDTGLFWALDGDHEAGLGRPMGVVLQALVLGTMAAVMLNLGPFGIASPSLQAAGVTLAPNPIQVTPVAFTTTELSTRLPDDSPPPNPVPKASNTTPPPPKPKPAASTKPTAKTASRPSAKTTERHNDDTPPPKPAPTAAKAETGSADTAQSIRLLVRDRHGKPIVARVHGRLGNRTAVLLPDGSIGWPDGLIPTEQPFVPATPQELETELRQEFPGFKTRISNRYVLVYQSSEHFADASLQVLEKLNDRLMDVLRKRDFPVQNPEFPLIAVIFKTEANFRAFKPVDPTVQAYYEIYSNRIFFYESASRENQAPEISKLRKPQTVAHEGTHQILQNIGVHPRLSDWPPWLIEGFAEYCSPPKILRDGKTDWAGLGQINPIHVATLRELDDPVSTLLSPREQPTITRNRNVPMIQYLVTKSELTPTDYALSWALTYYLANDRHKEFVAYLRKLSKLAPFEKRSPEQHLDDFKVIFGTNLAKLSGQVNQTLGRRFSKVETLPFYAVLYEQAVPTGTIRRAMVSQSESMINQWVETVSNPRGAAPRWQALAHPTKAQALLTAQHWMESR